MEILGGIANVAENCRFDKEHNHIFLIDLPEIQDHEITIHTRYRRLNLSQLNQIELFHNAVDPEQRRLAAETEADRIQKERNDNALTNVVAGAVLGGVVDSISGDDDSVVDGAIMGAIVGYAASDTSRPTIRVDLTENKLHFVNLYFQDGTAITVNASNSEIAHLHRCLVVAQKNQSAESASTIEEYGPDKDQLAIGLSKRKEREIESAMPGSVIALKLFGNILAIAGSCLAIFTMMFMNFDLTGNWTIEILSIYAVLVLIGMFLIWKGGRSESEFVVQFESQWNDQ